MSGPRRLRRGRRARDDLMEIWSRIATDDPSAADRLLDGMDESCLRLTAHPLLGAARDDIRAGLRYLVVGA